MLGLVRLVDAGRDQPVVDLSGLEQPLPGERRRGEDVGAHRLAASTAAATRIASSASTSWRRSISAPCCDGQRGRRQGRGAALVGVEAPLPGAGDDRAEEVLAREGDEQRTPELAQLAEPAHDLDPVVGREVEVEARVERDPLRVDPDRGGALEPLGEPALQVRDDVAVAAATGGRPAAGPRCA